MELCEGYTFLLSDFGQGKHFDDDLIASSTKRKFLRPVGRYIAPEVLAGNDKSTESDVYSFGRIGQKIINLKRWIKSESSNGFGTNGIDTVPTVIKTILDQCTSGIRTDRPKWAAVTDSLENLETSIEKREAKWTPWIVDDSAEREYLADRPLVSSTGDLSRIEAELSDLKHALGW